VSLARQRDDLEVPCRIDIEHSAHSLHAIVELELPEIRPGDEVRLLDAPTAIRAGDRLVRQGSAAVHRAGRLRRMLTRMGSYRELFDLFEVGFSDGRMK